MFVPRLGHPLDMATETRVVGGTQPVFRSHVQVDKAAVARNLASIDFVAAEDMSDVVNIAAAVHMAAVYMRSNLAEAVHIAAKEELLG